MNQDSLASEESSHSRALDIKVWLVVSESDDITYVDLVDIPFDSGHMEFAFQDSPLGVWACVASTEDPDIFLGRVMITLDGTWVPRND